jgi:SAM-dependent methyltransferase
MVDHIQLTPPSAHQSNYDPFARIHNESWGPDDTKSALPFVEKILLGGLLANAHILDLCCGTGQLAQYLLCKGYQVTGIDLSSAMLDYARKNAPDAEFVVADARDFHLPTQFQGVISTTYGLNHILSLEELTQVFENVYAVLQEKGLFVFDLSLIERYQASWHGSMLGDVTADYAWALKRHYQAAENIGQIAIAIFERLDHLWQRTDATWLVRGYSVPQVQLALTQTGFQDITVHHPQAFNEEKEPGIVYFVCRK